MIKRVRGEELMETRKEFPWRDRRVKKKRWTIILFFILGAVVGGIVPLLSLALGFGFWTETAKTVLNIGNGILWGIAFHIWWHRCHEGLLPPRE
ncbi:hypothetical protein HY407_01810 [Candidatus Gottesmanbacteria bacterium]|nr:hypothetical protein [Candidatus Gottesmanbacteria bacterium]